ncbi:biotin--[acetyl-CoA-carboxylase] ligase [Weissella soli]|uniref:biotin--[acetyl-CoA-carboxylase] ligase n=1 Tax=Weissella soli TaxID=155866 RepID=UPI001F249CB5|nr:biotin--[acetyl-CoA-carboxylase] ligase [Weissella soli]GJM48898.1 bifunctional ligase/repressor BirA [Weissella soli]
MLNKNAIIQAVHPAIQVEVFEKISSTNTYAQQHVDQTHMTAVVATEQTAGYGRQGRSFYSPKTGLYLTFVVPFDVVATKTPGIITTLIALATQRVLAQAFQVMTEIKWVNDLYRHDKKVAGILVEQTDQAYVIGMGLNVQAFDVPGALQDKITHVFDETIDRNVLVGLLLNAWFETITQTTQLDVSAYKAVSYLLNKTVTLNYNRTLLTGRVIDFGQQGELILDVNGATLAIRSGEVTKVVEIEGKVLK